MLDAVSTDAMIKALQNKLQVTINYTKKSTGEAVTHTGGIQEIDGNILWLWDTSLNDHIRKFLLENITGIQVLDVPFFPTGGFPLKLNGEILGY
jgi:hypothetical protein